jgi:hypothetical protein
MFKYNPRCMLLFKETFKVRIKRAGKGIPLKGWTVEWKRRLILEILINQIKEPLKCSINYLAPPTWGKNSFAFWESKSLLPFSLFDGFFFASF